MRELILITALLLTACATAGAEPERYAGFDCAQLADLKRSYTQSSARYDLFQDSDINELERRNASKRNLADVGQSRPDLRPYEVEQEKEINSIRAASRLKGC
ncbi:hypothetical protein [Hellea balneolensis]|uniref:hypothetical protein n=1 Tax=Hellea balneolensis TaxID=287478 RepID=UPI000405178D|nr:hypothetical protein [Hellea balneolensis]